MSEYIFRIKTRGGLEPDLKIGLKKATAEDATARLRFRLYARDSFSNYGAVFTQYWRKDEPPYGPVVRGCWPVVGSLDFKPARDQATRFQSEETVEIKKETDRLNKEREAQRERIDSFQEQLAGVIHDLRQKLDREKEQRRDFTDQQARPPITPTMETAAAPGKQLLWAFVATTLFAWFSRERSAHQIGRRPARKPVAVA
jgi:hypothetical protein